ncbi:hypothetical protein [Hyphomonas johnsonii]|jgi:hypothetical protein|uniref:Uncharacterized protein n=1 Tax=Hyphomonas johnsonii MHS-2 TaxID=1280950 RepID=A0A059FJD1_9PROT|nr:hypothetical protein [Hyphomonas johnsonii]KCZ90636.1 hypothetical protein HJO_12331 [Hyphomonas johnsonii MHS-2]
MTQNATGHLHFNLSDALRGAVGLFVRLMIGMLLVMTAGIVAVMTAIAGLMLAGAALVMRFAGSPRAHGRTTRPAQDDGPVTLDARRTPRGWTVE